MKYYEFVKYILEGGEMEFNLIDEFHFGENLVFDIDDFKYDDGEDEELDYENARDWMEDRMGDVAGEYQNKDWYVRKVKDELIMCPREYRRILDVIVETIDG